MAPARGAGVRRARPLFRHRALSPLHPPLRLPEPISPAPHLRLQHGAHAERHLRRARLRGPHREVDGARTRRVPLQRGSPHLARLDSQALRGRGVLPVPLGAGTPHRHHLALRGLRPVRGRGCALRCAAAGGGRKALSGGPGGGAVPKHPAGHARLPEADASGSNSRAPPPRSIPRTSAPAGRSSPAAG